MGFALAIFVVDVVFFLGGVEVGFDVFLLFTFSVIVDVVAGAFSLTIVVLNVELLLPLFSLLHIPLELT